MAIKEKDSDLLPETSRKFTMAFQLDDGSQIFIMEKNHQTPWYCDDQLKEQGVPLIDILN